MTETRTMTIMLELLRCRASPALPASLLTLRQKSWKPVRLFAPLRCDQLSVCHVHRRILSHGRFCHRYVRQARASAALVCA